MTCQICRKNNCQRKTKQSGTCGPKSTSYNSSSRLKKHTTSRSMSQWSVLTHKRFRTNSRSNLKVNFRSRRTIMSNDCKVCSRKSWWALKAPSAVMDVCSHSRVAKPLVSKLFSRASKRNCCRKGWTRHVCPLKWSTNRNRHWRNSKLICSLRINSLIVRTTRYCNFDSHRNRRLSYRRTQVKCNLEVSGNKQMCGFVKAVCRNFTRI